MKNLFKFLILGFVVISFMAQAQTLVEKQILQDIEPPPKDKKSKKTGTDYMTPSQPKGGTMQDSQTPSDTTPPDITDTNAFTLIATLTPNEISLKNPEWGSLEDGEIDDESIHSFSTFLYFGSLGGASDLDRQATDNLYNFWYHRLDPDGVYYNAYYLAKIGLAVFKAVAGQDNYVIEVVFHRTFVQPTRPQALVLKHGATESEVAVPDTHYAGDFSLISNVFSVDCPPDAYEYCSESFNIYKKFPREYLSGYMKAFRLYKQVQ